MPKKGRVISCDEAIIEISELLIQSSAEWITEIYNRVANGKAHYEGDNLITVIEEDYQTKGNMKDFDVFKKACKHHSEDLNTCSYGDRDMASDNCLSNYCPLS